LGDHTAAKVRGLSPAQIFAPYSSAQQSPTRVRPYSEAVLRTFALCAVVSAVLTVWAVQANWEYATPLRTFFLGCTTIAAYVWGARMPQEVVQIAHPLVTGTVVLLCVMGGLARATDSSFKQVLRTYRVNSLEWREAGAGDILLYLLGPSVVSFAISMYSRKQLLFSNFWVVLTAVLVSAAGGLFGTAAFVNLIQLGGSGGRTVRLSVLSRNVTTALSMALANMLGGDMSIAASAVVLTGITGATLGKRVLAKLGMTDPVTRGLAMGASSQGLGVAAISDEPDAFPFAAISMVMTAIVATCIVAVPSAQSKLIQLATSNTLKHAAKVA
jgi:putative effector of murein hydrolase